MSLKPCEVFVIHHVHPDYAADSTMKIGFILWLKTLAQELDYSFSCSPFGVELKKGDKIVLICGVRPSDQSAMVDFLSLLIDREELESNRKLFCRLTMIDARPAGSLAGEEEKTFWLLDPLRKASRSLLIQHFEHFWAEGIGEIFGCDAQKVEGASCFNLIYRADGISVALLEKNSEKIVIKPYSPFAASGLFREFYCLGKTKPDMRFEPLFRIRQEEMVTPLVKESDDEEED